MKNYAKVNISYSLLIIFFLSYMNIISQQVEPNFNGEYNPLPIESENDVVFKSFNLNGWDVFVRILYTNKTREPDLIGKYSILFHDPNDSLDMILNRNLVYQDVKNPNNIEWTTVRERHNNELGRNV